MVCFYRDFSYTSIEIKIDNTIYYQNKNVFDVLFFTYSKSNEIKNDKRKVIYICDSNISSEILCRYHCDYYHLCDFTIENWINILISFLEYCYEKILMCTILHGSCLVFKDKGIMLLGGSGSGKSTLIYHLIQHNNAFYLDDDAVYMINNVFIGFNTPIRMRKKDDNNIRLLEIEKSTASLKRYTYDVKDEQKISNIERISYIIFPKYQKNIELESSEITGYALINNIMSNVKGLTNMFTAYKDVPCCFNNIKAYEIKYNNCFNVVEFLDNII